MRGITVVVTAGALVAGMTLAACSSTTNGSGSGRHASTTAANTASGSAGPSTSSTPPPSSAASSAPPASPTTSAAAIPQCLNDIRVIPGQSQGAAGHIALVLVFNNVSTTVTCQIYGYPGVDLVTASGATVAHLARTPRGMAGGLPQGQTTPQPVTLAPGQSASALAEASDVPTGSTANCGSYNLLITVPNQTVSVGGGTAQLPMCDAQIHPVVAGTTGGEGS